MPTGIQQQIKIADAALSPAGNRSRPHGFVGGHDTLRQLYWKIQPQTVSTDPQTQVFGHISSHCQSRRLPSSTTLQNVDFSQVDLPITLVCKAPVNTTIEVIDQQWTGL